MAQGPRDEWALGDAYDAYMGRWSRRVASEFVPWIAVEPGSCWLEVGCGTGALTSTVCLLAEPRSIMACDPSTPFVDHARKNMADPRVAHAAASAEALPTRTGGFDVAVSGLVLNFIADPIAALRAMRERVRPGGIVAGYVWDYAGGVELLQHFWEEAGALDPEAIALDESRRFAGWQLSFFASLFEAAGLTRVRSAVLTIPMTFANFDDYWRPFLGGTGPAPSYVASLTQTQRDALAERLRTRLPAAEDGHIRLHARALAAMGEVGV